MSEDLNLYSRIIQAFQTEPFLYFDYSNSQNSVSIFDHKLELTILGVKGTNILIKLNYSNLHTVINFINFSLDQYKKPIVFNEAKSFQSFCLKHNSNGLNNLYVFDICWFKSYIGQKNNKNFESLVEVAGTFISMCKSNVLDIYKNVFQKLICSTIPYIENQFLINDDNAEKVYPFYIIEGQENGRLNTKVLSSKNYNPHTLDYEAKDKLVNPYENEVFINFDYRAMELSVLAALSNDEKLLMMFANGDDPYERIGKIIMPLESSNFRKYGKNIFLPVIYGMSAKTLAEVFSLGYETSVDIISNLKSEFNKSFHYIETSQNEAKVNSKLSDKFGRIRHFAQDEIFKSRNFIIQSSTATINQVVLNKLVDKKNAFDYRVLYSVYDAYCISVSKFKAREVFYSVKSLLQENLDVIPGLTLFAEGKVGRYLNKMTKIKN